MNIGDGLTLHTRTVDGKPTPGIFLMKPSAQSKNSKQKFSYKSRGVRYPIREKLPNQLSENKHSNNNNNRPIVNNNRPNQRKDISKNTENDVLLIDNNKKKNDRDLTKNNRNVKSKSPSVPKDGKLQSENKTKGNEKQEQKITRKVSEQQRATKVNQKPIRNPNLKSKNDETKQDKETATNPKFVTLTQDQLNTILSLVKTKHDIDVSAVIKKSNAKDGSENSDSSSTINDSESVSQRSEVNSDATASDDDEIRTVRPTSVPGLDLEKEDSTVTNLSEKSKEKKKSKSKNDMKRNESAKKKSTEEDSSKTIDSDKENQSKQEDETEDARASTADLMWGVLGGFGNRDKNKTTLEKQRQEWIKDLEDQVNRNKQLKEEEFQKRKGIKSLSSNDIPAQNEAGHEESLLDLVEGGNKKSDEKISKKSSSSKKSKNRIKDVQKETQRTKKKSVRSAPASAKNDPEEKNEKVSTQEVLNPENLPAAIRSSFFPGESAPREHAFSATKHEQQRRWRLELDKQRQEQQERKEKERNKLRSSDDENLWFRHFDTMQPKRSLDINDSGASTSNDRVIQLEEIAKNNAESSFVPNPSSGNPNYAEKNSDSMEGPLTSSINSVLSGADYLRGKESTGVRDPNKSTYLRTMTSLLDPAQIEAIEVRRRKQEEHRNAISEQVAERKRRKEDEENNQRRRDQIEEQKLKNEREQLDHQFEIEKLKQKMQESKREEQTRKLYEQLQEAEASALRDKLKQRERLLRARGHDVSQLERAHNTELESHKVINTPRETNIQTQPQGNLNQQHVRNEPVPTGRNTQVIQSGRGVVPIPVNQSVDQSPISVLANTSNGPIRLEISLSNNAISKAHEAVETGMQTVSTETDRRYNLNTSDAETEYFSLPEPRQREKKKTKPVADNRQGKSLQKYEEGLNKQYDKYSRREQATTSKEQSKVVKNEGQKPKWGVPLKGRKFVPASQRYVKSMKFNERHEQNLKRREEQLIAQQNLNDPQHLRVMSKARIEEEERNSYEDRVIPTHKRRPKSPVVPVVARQWEEAREKKRNRSHSPTKATNSKHTTTQNHSKSPPIHAKKHDLSPRQVQGQRLQMEQQMSRPETVISVTTEKAKYRPGKHSRDSPVPQTSDFVQYRRTADILDPTTSPDRVGSRVDQVPVQAHYERDTPAESQPIQNRDPLTNPDMIRQRERQDQILREISILRQGLLLKQREVASYPVALTSSITSMGENLPERTNDTPNE